MMEVVLYTIGCPKCIILEKKLDSAGIEYKKVTDIDEMTARQFTELPLLEVDGEIMNFVASVNWLNER